MVTHGVYRPLKDDCFFPIFMIHSGRNVFLHFWLSSNIMENSKSQNHQTGRLKKSAKSRSCRFNHVPSLKLTVRTWKLMVGYLHFLLKGCPFSGAFAVSFREGKDTHKKEQQKQRIPQTRNCVVSRVPIPFASHQPNQPTAVQCRRVGVAAPVKAHHIFVGGGRHGLWVIDGYWGAGFLMFYAKQFPLFPYFFGTFRHVFCSMTQCFGYFSVQPLEIPYRTVNESRARACHGVRSVGCTNHRISTSYEPWSKVIILGMVIQPLIGNPYNGYINPYYWVDDHPLLYGNNGSLDPSTY